MPPNKGGNAKKEAGRAKKAENEASSPPFAPLSPQYPPLEDKKKEAVTKVKEAKEAETWKDGAKAVSKADVAAAKAAEQGGFTLPSSFQALNTSSSPQTTPPAVKVPEAVEKVLKAARKKAEREALLAAEESSLPSKTKSAPKAGQKKKPPTTSLAPAVGGGVSAYNIDDPLGLRRPDKDAGEGEVTELSAQGIDQIMEAMELVNLKTDKESMGAKAGLIEKHPERRFKAAFEAYLDREIPILKDEHPGLRQNQMRDILFKKFQKAPENPFNQVQIAYNASKDEKVAALQQVMEAREEKYRVDN